MPAAWFLNGPNANLYGLDAKGTYGRESWPQLRERCLDVAAAHGLELDMRQTNDEGELVTWIQQARSEAQGLLINAAGLSYTSVAVLDALLLFEGPVLEVHMSNIHRREPFRDRTFTSKGAKGGIFGLGALGYELAVIAMARLLSE
ncbi:type II 3-dehydroquinate dehydratase [Sabulicella glaciei]|uniref:3-dehydroquinate dehydratase n=1 Tax=Sabulicella glaciei TaxID=2984948 RepID=A0ABT3NVT9_9PROT|nr:type II 3-dehydroquinate dehydratase [Roseococcus sp. MDT2-1-1]MCW8086279.1 3-dehydroquinate dehydratase [Roseococcus sp. MDT2-1-1]